MPPPDDRPLDEIGDPQCVQKSDFFLVPYQTMWQTYRYVEA